MKVMDKFGFSAPTFNPFQDIRFSRNSGTRKPRKFGIRKSGIRKSRSFGITNLRNYAGNLRNSGVFIGEDLHE
jgi:hypothetical protein